MRNLLIVGVLVAFCAFESAYSWDDYGRRGGHHEDDDVYSKKVCSLALKRGNCGMSYARYYYSASDKICKKFTWLGCERNGNHFESLSHCNKECAWKINPERKHCDGYSLTVRMKNPIDFYNKNKDQYIKNFKAAVCTQLPLTVSQVQVKKVVQGSTVLFVFINHSFTDEQPLETFMKKVSAGKFTFNVAGQTVSSVEHQRTTFDRKWDDDYDERGHHKKGWKKTVFCVVGFVVFICIIIGIVICCKKSKKRMRASPMETAKAAVASVWNSHNTMPPPAMPVNEKLEMPPMDEKPPAYEAGAPPPYAQMPGAYAIGGVPPPPQPQPEAYPEKDPNAFPA